MRLVPVVAMSGLGAIAASNVVIKAAAWGRIRDVDQAPDAPVAIVLGARVRNGHPMPMLAGRLNTAVALVRRGRVTSVLVSGDADGTSGDEIAAMTDYLIANGVAPERIVGDPLGACTYDSFARAAATYGIERALVVTQRFHLWRSVAICRAVGIDAVGIVAECDCRRTTLIRNLAREWLLSEPKAVLDLMLRQRRASGSSESAAISWRRLRRSPTR